MEPAIEARFRKRFGVAHTVVLAPMDIISGGGHGMDSGFTALLPPARDLAAPD